MRTDEAAPGGAGTRVGYPSGQREQTVNLPAQAFEGSNPSPTIRRIRDRAMRTAKVWSRRSAMRYRRAGTIAGVAQLVERKPSKLDVAGSSPVSRSHAGASARVSDGVPAGGY